MSNHCAPAAGVGRIRIRVRVASLLIAGAVGTCALADTPAADQSRATIRGTGSDVSIVYRGTAKPQVGPGPRQGAKAGRVEAAPRSDVLTEATRLAAGGADAGSLIAYLRTHQADLPVIVSADAMRRLKKAGAGPAVATELTRLAAVDIGDTAQGNPPADRVFAAQAEAGEELPSFYSNGYPFYASGGVPRHRHGERGLDRQRMPASQSPSSPGAPRVPGMRMRTRQDANRSPLHGLPPLNGRALFLQPQ